MASTFSNGEGGLSIRTKLNANATETTTATTNVATNTSSITTNAATVTSHIANVSNPHAVTKAQVGLGNCDNTSDANKPVSTATANAIANKQDANAISTLFANITPSAVSVTMGAGDENNIYVITNAGATNFTIPLNLAAGFDYGACVWVYNTSASTSTVTIVPAGGVTVTYTTLRIIPGNFAKIVRISANEYVRVNDLPLDLITIAALSSSNDDIIQRKAGAWTNRTLAQYKADLSLNNVDNTSDANKPVSTAGAAADALKQDKDAVSTLCDTVVDTSASVTVGNSNINTLWNIDTSGGAKTFTINNGLTILKGGKFIVYNSGAAANNVTVAGTATVVYGNALTAVIADGEVACFKKIATNTYLRIS